LAVMAYFVLRLRWKKLAAVGRGISDGLFKSYTS